MDTLDHGNYSTYYNKKCRCDLCKAAASAYVKAKKAKGLPEGDSRHGSMNGYFGWGCRCELCTSAMNTYVRTEERRKSQRDRHLQSSYSLTQPEWDDLWDSQGKACASCGDSQQSGKRRFHVDHDHVTGEVRGILCHGCNVALGHLKDDRNRILALADYLSRSESV